MKELLRDGDRRRFDENYCPTVLDHLGDHALARGPHEAIGAIVARASGDGHGIDELLADDRNGLAIIGQALDLDTRDARVLDELHPITGGLASGATGDDDHEQNNDGLHG